MTEKNSRKKMKPNIGLQKTMMFKVLKVFKLVVSGGPGLNQAREEVIGAT